MIHKAYHPSQPIASIRSLLVHGKKATRKKKKNKRRNIKSKRSQCLVCLFMFVTPQCVSATVFTLHCIGSAHFIRAEDTQCIFFSIDIFLYTLFQMRCSYGTTHTALAGIVRSIIYCTCINVVVGERNEMRRESPSILINTMYL